jgi:hypothetical protein
MRAKLMINTASRRQRPLLARSGPLAMVISGVGTTIHWIELLLSSSIRDNSTS